MAHVTDHAKQRTKERLGLSKRLAEKNAERPYGKGSGIRTRPGAFTAM